MIINKNININKLLKNPNIVINKLYKIDKNLNNKAQKTRTLNANKINS